MNCNVELVHAPIIIAPLVQFRMPRLLQAVQEPRVSSPHIHLREKFIKWAKASQVDQAWRASMIHHKYTMKSFPINIQKSSSFSAHEFFTLVGYWAFAQI